MANLELTTETKKLKIDTTVTKTERIQADIDLPYYGQESKDNYLAVLDEQRIMLIDCSEGWAEVQMRSVKYYLDRISKTTQITEQEFEEKLQLAYSFIPETVISKQEAEPITEREYFGEDDLMDRRAS